MKLYRYHIFLVLTQIVHKLDNHIDSIILSYQGGEGTGTAAGRGEDVLEIYQNDTMI